MPKKEILGQVNSADVLTKEQLATTITGLADVFRDSSRKEAIVDPLYIEYAEAMDKKPEFKKDQMWLFSCRIKKVKEALLAKSLNTNDTYIIAVYEKYGFIESNLIGIMSKFYGGACSVDRASFLVSWYAKSLQDKKPLPFNWDQEYTYQIPKYISEQSWFEYIKILANLAWGNTCEGMVKLLQKYTELLREFNENKPDIEGDTKK